MKYSLSNKIYVKTKSKNLNSNVEFEYIYNSNGYMTHEIFNNTIAVEYKYNTSNILIGYTDFDDAYEYTYDTNGNLDLILSTDGTVHATHIYDSDNRLIEKVFNEYDTYVYYRYDSNGNLESQLLQDGEYTYDYDDNNLTISESYQDYYGDDSYTSIFTYRDNKIISEYKQWDDVSETYTYEYDSHGNLIRISSETYNIEYEYEMKYFL